MSGDGRPFLRAEWRHLAMLNFDIDPRVLGPLVPRGSELDDWAGRTYVTLVGFRFVNTRVLGLSIPFHRDFEEVNLRFYVRRRAPDGWRRAVVFVKEIVPRAAIALVARALYHEPYAALPMRHRLERAEGDGRVLSVSYEWDFAGRTQHLFLAAAEPPSDVPGDSEAEFVVEHYWGLSVQPDGGTLEYRVEHPRWRVAPASGVGLDCDAGRLYGPAFAEPLSRPPASAFLAEGSEVRVYRGVRLAG